MSGKWDGQFIPHDGQDVLEQDWNALIDTTGDEIAGRAISLDRNNLVPPCCGILQGLEVSYLGGTTEIQVAAGSAILNTGVFSKIPTPLTVAWDHTADVGKYVVLRSVLSNDPASLRENPMTHVLEPMRVLMTQSLVLVAVGALDYSTDVVVGRVTAKTLENEPVFGVRAEFAYPDNITQALMVYPVSAGVDVYGPGGNKHFIRFVGLPGSSLWVREFAEPAGLGTFYLEVQLECDALGAVISTFGDVVTLINTMTRFRATSLTPLVVVPSAFLTTYADYSALVGGNDYRQYYQAAIGSASMAELFRYNLNDPFSLHIAQKGSGVPSAHNPHAIAPKDIGFDPEQTSDHIRREHFNEASIPRLTSAVFLEPSLVSSNQVVKVAAGGADDVALLSGSAYGLGTDYLWNAFSAGVLDYNLYLFYMNTVGVVTKKIVASLPSTMPFRSGTNPIFTFVDTHPQLNGASVIQLTVSGVGTTYSLSVGGGVPVDISVVGQIYRLYTNTGLWVDVYRENFALADGVYSDTATFDEHVSRTVLEIAMVPWLGQKAEFGYGPFNLLTDKRKYGSFEQMHDRNLIFARNSRNALLVDTWSGSMLFGPVIGASFDYVLHKFSVEYKGSTIVIEDTTGTRTIAPSKTWHHWLCFRNNFEWTIEVQDTFVAHDLDTCFYLGYLTSDGVGIISAASFPMPGNSAQDVGHFVVGSGTDFMNVISYIYQMSINNEKRRFHIDIERDIAVTDLPAWVSGLVVDVLDIDGHGNTLTLSGADVRIVAQNLRVRNLRISTSRSAVFDARTTAVLDTVDIRCTASTSLPFVLGSGGGYMYVNDSFFGGSGIGVSADAPLFAGFAKTEINGSLVLCGDAPCSMAATPGAEEQLACVNSELDFVVTGISKATFVGCISRVTVLDAAGAAASVMFSGCFVAPKSGGTYNYVIAKDMAACTEIATTYDNCEMFGATAHNVSSAYPETLSFIGTVFRAAQTITHTKPMAAAPRTRINIERCAVPVAGSSFTGSNVVDAAVSLKDTDFSLMSFSFAQSGQSVEVHNCRFAGFALRNTVELKATKATFTDKISVLGSAPVLEQQFVFSQCRFALAAKALFEINAVGAIKAYMSDCEVECANILKAGTVAAYADAVTLFMSNCYVSQSNNIDMADPAKVSTSASFVFRAVNSYIGNMKTYFRGSLDFRISNCYLYDIYLGDAANPLQVGGQCLISNSFLRFQSIWIDNAAGQSLNLRCDNCTAYFLGAAYNVDGSAANELNIYLDGGYLSATAFGTVSGSGSFGMRVSDAVVAALSITPQTAGHRFVFSQCTVTGAITAPLDETGGENHWVFNGCRFLDSMTFNTPGAAGTTATEMCFNACRFEGTGTLTITGEKNSALSPGKMLLSFVSCVFDDNGTYATEIYMSYSDESVLVCDGVINRTVTRFYVENYGGDIRILNCVFGSYSAPKTSPLLSPFRHAEMDISVRVSFTSSQVYCRYPIYCGDVVNSAGLLDVHLTDAEVRCYYFIDDIRLGAGIARTSVKGVNSAFSSYTGASQGNMLVYKENPATGPDRVTDCTLSLNFTQCSFSNMRAYMQQAAVGTPLTLEVTAAFDRCSISLDGGATYKNYDFMFLDPGELSGINLLFTNCSIYQEISRSGYREGFVHLGASGASIADGLLFEGSARFVGGSYRCVFNGAITPLFGGFLLFSAEQNDAAVTENICDAVIEVGGMSFDVGTPSTFNTGSQGFGVVVAGQSFGVAANANVKFRGAVSIHDLTVEGAGSSDYSYWNLLCGWYPLLGFTLKQCARFEGYTDKHSVVSVKNCTLQKLSRVNTVDSLAYTSYISVQGRDLALGGGIINNPRVNIEVCGVVADEYSKFLVETVQETHYKSGGIEFDYNNSLVISHCSGLRCSIYKARKVSICGNTRLNQVEFDLVTDDVNKYVYTGMTDNEIVALEIAASGNVSERALPGSWFLFNMPGGEDRARAVIITLGNSNAFFGGGGGYLVEKNVAKATPPETVAALIDGVAYRGATGTRLNVAGAVTDTYIILW